MELLTDSDSFRISALLALFLFPDLAVAFGAGISSAKDNVLMYVRKAIPALSRSSTFIIMVTMAIPLVQRS